MGTAVESDRRITSFYSLLTIRYSLLTIRSELIPALQTSHTLPSSPLTKGRSLEASSKRSGERRLPAGSRKPRRRVAPGTTVGHYKTRPSART